MKVISNLLSKRKKLLITIPIVSIAPPILFTILGIKKFSSPDFLKEFLFGFFYSSLITSVITIGCFIIIDYLQFKFPWGKNNYKRFVLELLITQLHAGFSTYIINYLLFFLGFCDQDFINENLSINLLVTNGITLVMTTYMEAMFFFREWKNSIIMNEHLQRENIEVQFEALRNQINPHFMFNSLNALSGLVYTDPEKAERFIVEFSRVYRYMLDLKNKPLVTLKEELEFLQSYIFLHKIRFGENLIVQMNLENADFDGLVPSLSLQLIFENVIKHNIISDQYPLTVAIVCNGYQVEMKNTIQIKKIIYEESGIGLKNLTKRYQILSNKTPIFKQDEYYYSATLPLISNKDV
jgi:sensor histidine kinase YesM